VNRETTLSIAGWSTSAIGQRVFRLEDPSRIPDAARSSEEALLRGTPQRSFRSENWIGAEHIQRRLGRFPACGRAFRIPSMKTDLSSRRAFFSQLGTLAASTSLLARDYGPDAPPVRYPEPDVRVLERSFERYKVGSAPIERLFTGGYWMEGPAWSGWGHYLVWSDIPKDQQHRYLEEDGHVSVLRQPANFSNGNTFDREGRQISFEHGTRRVARYERDGSVTILADRFEGKRLNAPNDGVVDPDGAVWFTDPGYGSLGNYEGNKGDLELKEAVYRIDPSGRLDRVTDEIFKPNGLCFSPDYKKLYVADTGASHDSKAPKNIKVWDVVDGRLRNGREFASMKMSVRGQEVAGLADGIRCDRDGNVWAAMGWVGEGYDGVHVFSPEGQRIGQIVLPEICSNVCFGGRRRNRLFMTASRSLYAVYTEALGAHWC
jgi:gluconolactonase